MNKLLIIGGVLLFPIIIIIKTIMNKDKYGTNPTGTNPDMKLPRGLRNNNPGNIRINNANNWRGKVPVSENTDGAFEQFRDYTHTDGVMRKGMVWGTRALTKLGWTYLRQNPNHSIMSFISKYAPSNENNTLAYAQSVANYLNTSIDARVKPIYEDSTLQYLFILAIIRHENGILYDNQDISDGVQLGNI